MRAKDITRKNSPNHFKGRKGEKPIMIVNHITEGYAMGAVSWLCNPRSQASAHFVVTREGKIYQLVDIRDAAWCNGTGTNPQGKYYYKRSTNSIVRSKAINANLFTISIEHEGFSYKEGRGALTEKQYAATLWLHGYIDSEVKRIYGYNINFDRMHVVGHYVIAPKEKPNCPGPLFPWDRLINDLNKTKGSDAVEKVKFDFKGRKLDVEGKLISGRNYVQARELLEKLGYKVDWNQSTKEIIVR